MVKKKKKNDDEFINKYTNTEAKPCPPCMLDNVLHGK